MLRLGFSATNPCHLYPLAQAASEFERSITYYSGYPRWRLRSPYPANLRIHSFRTLITYGLLRVPERFRPKSRSLFLWQDRGFDRWVGKRLDPHDFIHAIPGQALETFRRARSLGIRTVLNHATGPSRHWVQIMQGEYERVGIDVARVTVYDDSYWARETEEYRLADLHCVASTVVRDQLLECGVPSERIWIVPYGASPDIFFPPREKRFDSFRILFAGQLTLRKGIATLLRALSEVNAQKWTVDFLGSVGEEVRKDLAGYRGQIPIRFHGAVSQSTLAEAMRTSSVLVLPSLEEGFGLVVPQALACGTPCIVSDRVGARDLISHRENGSIFAVGDSSALAAELRFWEEQRVVIQGDFSWRQPARRLISLSREALMPVKATPFGPRL
jgi:glycosyltransferase involved in cell wall biosynthesis